MHVSFCQDYLRVHGLALLDRRSSARPMSHRIRNPTTSRQACFLDRVDPRRVSLTPQPRLSQQPPPPFNPPPRALQTSWPTSRSPSLRARRVREAACGAPPPPSALGDLRRAAPSLPVCPPAAELVDYEEEEEAPAADDKAAGDETVKKCVGAAGRGACLACVRGRGRCCAGDAALTCGRAALPSARGEPAAPSSAPPSPRNIAQSPHAARPTRASPLARHPRPSVLTDHPAATSFFWRHSGCLSASRRACACCRADPPLLPKGLRGHPLVRLPRLPAQA